MEFNFPTFTLLIKPAATVTNIFDLLSKVNNCDDPLLK